MVRGSATKDGFGLYILGASVTSNVIAVVSFAQPVYRTSTTSGKYRRLQSNTLTRERINGLLDPRYRSGSTTHVPGILFQSAVVTTFAPLLHHSDPPLTGSADPGLFGLL